MFLLNKSIKIIKHLYTTSKVSMSHASLYFKNNLPELSESPESLEPNKEELKTLITNYTSEILKKFQPTEANADGGLYVGTAGVAYTLYYISKSKLFSATEQQAYLKHAENYLAASISYAKSRENDKSEKSSFILGNAGVNAITAVIMHQLGDDKANKHTNLYLEAADNCKPTNLLRCGSDELFVGRAGYICGALWLSKQINTDIIPLPILHQLCNTIIQSGLEYSKAHHFKVPLMYSYYNTEYLGAAHGLCSILLMLMSVPEYLETHPTESQLIKESVDFLLEIQTDSGNFPSTMDELPPNVRNESDDLVHWCHGAPGVVYTIAREFIVWNDPKYLESCVKCGDLVWEKGLLKKGPGICHGVAGNGYVFLFLYRLTGDCKHLFRAKQFAEFLKTETFKKDAKTPDAPYSLFEGICGTVCFLVDLAEPNQANFPFIDVF